MSDFNVDPNYKLKRRKQRRSQNKKSNIIITVGIVALLAVIVVVAISIFSGKTPANTVVTPAETEETEAPVETSDTNTTEPFETSVTEAPVTPGPTATKTDSPDKPVKVTTKIFIDAGHGAMNQSMDSLDRGAGGLYYELTDKFEDDLNLAISLKVRDLLEDIGYTVIMTRTGKVIKYCFSSDRADMANESERLPSFRYTQLGRLPPHTAQECSIIRTLRCCRLHCSCKFD